MTQLASPATNAGCPIQAGFWLEWDTTALDARLSAEWLTSKESDGCPRFAQAYLGRKRGRSPPELLGNPQAKVALSSINEKRQHPPVPRSRPDARGFVTSTNRARSRHSPSTGPTDGRLEPGRRGSLHERLRRLTSHHLRRPDRPIRLRHDSRTLQEALYEPQRRWEN